MSNSDRYAQQRNSKIPVTARQFAWLQDDDKGEVMLHVGPTMVAPRAAERLVVDDGQGQYISSPKPEPQRMIELNEMQYAVLFNPLADQRPDEGPNGTFRDGRNPPRPLLFGQRRMIPGPCSFCLWPGQRVEVRDAYELSSNQYLVVKVYGDIDTASPWYDITLRSAAITAATTEPLSQHDAPPHDALSRGQIIVIRGLDAHFYIPPSGVEVVPDLTTSDDGQQISTQQAQKLLASAPPPMPPPEPAVAQGIASSLGGGGGFGAAPPAAEAAAYASAPSSKGFSPPSPPSLSSPLYVRNLPAALDEGVDAFVGDAEGEDEADDSLYSPQRAKELAKRDLTRDDLEGDTRGRVAKKSAKPPPPPPPQSFAQVAPPRPSARPVGGPPGAPPPPFPASMPAPAPAPIPTPPPPPPRPAPIPTEAPKRKPPSVSDQQVAALSDKDIQSLTASDLHRQALERQARMGRLVRQAVMLGEKDFCILIDADGRRQIKVGPARIFPGPYDRFLTQGSRRRVYSAYELLPQRALWLRFVAEVSAARLRALLPQQVKLTQDAYLPGDDLLITGVNTFFFPFDEVEVLNPTTGQPHIGNDHDAVFIHAVGIDQRSGIYVQDLATGEVRTVKGQCTYLVDPRRERRIQRTIPTRDWNLWVASTQPRRRTSGPITTPWALAINVPNNAACMAISSTGRRVIEGPCIALLAFDERLATLRTGAPDDPTPSDADLTCFLPIQGDSLTAEVPVRSQDQIDLTLRLHLRLDFDPTLRDRWFDVEHPALHLYEFVHRAIRRGCALTPAFDLWARAQDIVRAALSPPRTMRENGMRIVDVELIQLAFDDPEVSAQLEASRRDLVARALADALDTRRLLAEQHRHRVATARLTLQQSLTRALADFDALQRTLRQAADLHSLRLAHALDEAQRDADARIESLRQAAALDRQAREAATLDALQRQRDAATAANQARLHAEANQHHQALQTVELSLLDARAEAAVAAARAIHPALIDAITGLGDRVLLADFARHLSLTNLLSPDLLDALRDLLQQPTSRPPAPHNPDSQG